MAATRRNKVQITVFVQQLTVPGPSLHIDTGLGAPVSRYLEVNKDQPAGGHRENMPESAPRSWGEVLHGPQSTHLRVRAAVCFGLVY